MGLKKFKLIKKTKLNNNIYELTFESNEIFIFSYWQFITFILQKIGWRAYSILEVNNKIFTLIVKKREKKDWWRWWSKYICEIEIWSILEWVWPSWHFTLQKNDNNKLFLWTGTGFVPLYNQIIWSLKENLNCNLKLIFWSKNSNDLFYINKLNKLKKENSNFDFEIFLSKEKINWYNKGYVIDYLTQNNIKNFEEYYICWIPKMINESMEILKKSWISKKNIFTEKY